MMSSHYKAIVSSLMMMNIIIVSSLLFSTEAFTISSCCTKRKNSLVLQMAPGGWGIGNPLDFKDEEFSSSSSSKRKRRRRKSPTSPSSSPSSSSSLDDTDEVAYNAETTEKIANLYSMEDAQQFSRRIQVEKQNLQLQKQKDLMEIAKIAGLGDRLKAKVNSSNNGEEFGKFDVDDDDDDDNLDVRVQWED